MAKKKKKQQPDKVVGLVHRRIVKVIIKDGKLNGVQFDDGSYLHGIAGGGAQTKTTEEGTERGMLTLRVFCNFLLTGEGTTGQVEPSLVATPDKKLVGPDGNPLQ